MVELKLKWRSNGSMVRSREDESGVGGVDSQQGFGAELILMK